MPVYTRGPGLVELRRVRGPYFKIEACFRAAGQVLKSQESRTHASTNLNSELCRVVLRARAPLDGRVGAQQSGLTPHLPGCPACPRAESGPSKRQTRTTMYQTRCEWRLTTLRMPARSATTIRLKSTTHTTMSARARTSTSAVPALETTQDGKGCAPLCKRCVLRIDRGACSCRSRRR